MALGSIEADGSVDYEWHSGEVGNGSGRSDLMVRLAQLHGLDKIGSSRVSSNLIEHGEKIYAL